VDPADPEARNEGFEGGAGLFEELPGACRVAIAVGKTNEGESLPANLILRIVLAGEDKEVFIYTYPIFVYPVPLSMTAASWRAILQGRPTQFEIRGQGKGGQEESKEA
jgi:hypothetical protein